MRRLRSFVFMRTTLSIALLAIGLLGTTRGMGQGCSDAGVCTAGPIGELNLSDSASNAPEHRHMARLTFSYAVGEQNTAILQVVPELALGLTDRWGLQLRVPYISADGNLGNNSGIGDAVITTSYAFVKNGVRRLDAMVGGKFPANKADADVDGKPLPMPYQTSLGTTDLLLGANYRSHRWNAALALQLAVDNANANGFRHSAWPGDDEAEGYFESWDLDRADDVVGRIQYVLPWKDLVVRPGVLAIYHLSEDVRTERTTDVAALERVAVDGSDGLTLNITIDALFALSAPWAIEASFGSPVITRAVRPDGLTRSMVLNLGLAYRFGK